MQQRLESVVRLGSYNLCKMGDEGVVTFVAETLEFKFGVRIWCFQECHKLSSSTEVPGYLLYKQTVNATAVLIPQIRSKLITGVFFATCCTIVILGKSFAIVSCYLADRSKCLETF